MNTEQIVSFIEGKASFDQKALSQIMLLLEKYPYFQTGHMFLLKAMHVTQSANYNNQLKISGSFISDKRKLFQFINTESNIPLIAEKDIVAKKENSIGIVTQNKEIAPEIKIVEIETLKIEKEEFVVSKEKDIEIEVEIIETKINKPEIINKNEELVIDENLVSKNINELSEEEIIQRNIEKSKKKHKEIVTDFFHSKYVENFEKKPVEIEKANKNVPEQIQFKKEKTENKNFSDKVKTEQKHQVDSDKTLDQLIEQKQEEVIVNEIAEETVGVKKEHEVIDIIEILPEKREIKEVIIEKVVSVEKELEIAENEKAVEIELYEEKPIVKEITQVTEPSKEIKETISTGSKKVESGSDAMNNIFSKIRQIKKEMNINSGETPEMIDVHTGNEKVSFSKIKITEEKKSTGRVIKESYIGFKEEEVNTEKTKFKEDEEKAVVETGEIKEIGITAKDLFKQHIKNKEQSPISEASSTISGSEFSDATRITPISKVVSSINKEKTSSKEIDGQKEQAPIKEIIKTESKTVIIEQPITTSKSTSAADSLLKKIEEKKRRMKEEKEREEAESLLNNNVKEEEIQEQNLAKEIKELTGISEPIIETKKETEIINEPNIETEVISNEVLTEENTIVPEVKANKTIKLIDNFIERIESLEKIGSKESTLSGDVSISSADEKDEFMTETMADIQIQQNNYPKAKEIYQKLILKFPEKKTYFAIQIKKVESLIKS